MRSDTTPAGSRHLPGIWEDTRQRIAELVEAVDEGAVDTRLATVPGATVRDALAHLAATATHAAESPQSFTAARSPHLIQDIERRSRRCAS